MAQIGLYAHLCQDSRTSGNRPPPWTPDPLPRSRPQEHGWTRGVGKGRWEKDFL